MGWFDRFRRRKPVEAAVEKPPTQNKQKVVTGAKDEDDFIKYSSFSNSNIVNFFCQ